MIASAVAGQVQYAPPALSSAFIEVGKGTKTMNQALKETLAKMIELVVQALVLKPLIAQMGNAFGSIGSGIGGATGGYASVSV